MYSTSIKTPIGDHAANPRFPDELKSLLRMASLYAWIIVSVAIVIVGAILAPMEHHQSTVDPPLERVHPPVSHDGSSRSVN